MNKILLTLICFVMTSFAFAQNYDWNRFERAFDNADQYQDTEMGTFATFMRKEEIENGHKANYFSAMGGFDNNGNFMSVRYDIISETWVMKDGNWHIDQWAFVYNWEFSRTTTWHRTMIQTDWGRVLELEYVQETEEAMSAKAEAILEMWNTQIK